MAVNHFHKTPIGNFLQFSEYASDFEYTRILNMAGLHRILNMSEYAGICVHMPKSAKMTFVLYFPIVIPYLKEPYSVFLKRQFF